MSDLIIERNEELGQGGSAVLLKGSFNNDIVAVKRYFGSRNRKTIRLLEEEASMILSLDHPNIVKCHGLCTDKIMALVLEQAGIIIKLDDIIYTNYSLRDLLDNYQSSFPIYKVGLTALHQVRKLF